VFVVSRVCESAETAELIEMPFGADSNGPRNHVLDEDPDSQRGSGNFWGLSGPLKNMVITSPAFQFQTTRKINNYRDGGSRRQDSHLAGVTLNFPCRERSTLCDTAC